MPAPRAAGTWLWMNMMFFSGSKPAGDILRELLKAPAAQIGRHLPYSDGVHIHDAVQAVIFILQAPPSF